MSGSDIDLILFASSTPDDGFGSATTVGAGIGATRAAAFDVTAACSGFVFSLVTAAQYLRSDPTLRHVLVVGADAMSRVVDWSDRSTCILFGDGAGAVVVSQAGEGAGCALLGHAMRSDGNGRRHLKLDALRVDKIGEAEAKALGAAADEPSERASLREHAPTLGRVPAPDGSLAFPLGGVADDPLGANGGAAKKGAAAAAAEDAKPSSPSASAFPCCPSAPPAYINVHMAGQEVFKFAVRAVPAIIDEALARSGLDKSEVDWLVMHQANQRILAAAAHRLGVPDERVVMNLDEYGNTSAASIPIALDEAVRAGSIQPGQVLAMAGFGAGLSWGGAIVRWG